MDILKLSELVNLKAVKEVLEQDILEETKLRPIKEKLEES